MATAYLFCGLPSSGKTTMAKTLAGRQDAERYTLDERMLNRYNLTIFDDEYGALANEEKEVIWREARRELDRGRDVILDWSLWSRAARQAWSARVLETGHAYKLFYLRAPLPLLRARLLQRNLDGKAGTHNIPIEEFDRFAPLFEAPDDAEMLNVECIDIDA